MHQRARPQLRSFIQAKRCHHARRHSTLELDPPDPSQHFSPQRHGLSQEQCRLANQLLRRAQQARPLRGTPLQQRFKFALRCAGIISAVKRNRVGNARFGHHLMGYRGGRVMQTHGLHILREIGPIGSLTARMNREKRQAQEIWERTGNVLAPGEKPARSPEEQRISSLITQWEESEWRAQQDRLNW